MFFCSFIPQMHRCHAALTAEAAARRPPGRGLYNRKVTRPPYPKFSPDPETEEPDPQTKRTILIEEVMRPQPGLEFLDWETLWVVEWLCEENGSINEGGPDLHEDFIHMTRNEMWPLVQATIYAFRGAISRAFA